MKRLLLLILLMAPGLALAQPPYVGDYLLGQTVRCPWNTHKPSTGTAIVRATAGTPGVYKDNGAGNGYNLTEFNGGLSDSAGTGIFDTDKTGAQVFVVDTTNAAYAAGVDYALIAHNTTITDTTTITLEEFICTFSIENRPPNKDRVKARGTLSTGNTTARVQLGAKISANNIWNGMIFWDTTTQEKAVICNTADNSSTDYLDVSGLVTSAGNNPDAYLILNDGPNSCVNLPKVDPNGHVYVGFEGTTNGSEVAISDKAAANREFYWDYGGNLATSLTISGHYNYLQWKSPTIDGISVGCWLAAMGSTLTSWSVIVPPTVTYRDLGNATNRVSTNVNSSGVRTNPVLNCPAGY